MSEKKAKYTSGPWTVKPSEDMIGHYILAEFAEKQRRVYHGGNPDSINIKDLIAEEKANAVLMEAAPDLLEACYRIEHVIMCCIETGEIISAENRDPMPTIHGAIEDVQAAIAKAKESKL